MTNRMRGRSDGLRWAHTDPRRSKSRSATPLSGYRTAPPLTRTIWPVRNAAAGPTRKRATRATSSGVPQRARGVSRRTRSCQVGGGRLAPGGLDPAGGHGVDADGRGQAQRQAPGEGHDRPLGGGEQLARVPLHAGLGLVPAHRDDRAAALLLHPPADLAAEPHRGHDVDGPEPVELGVEVEPGGRAGQGVGPGDLEPGVEPVPDVPGLVDEPVARGAVGQVGHEDLGPTPAVADLGRRPARRPRATTAVDDHVGPPRASARAAARPIPEVEPQDGRAKSFQVEWGRIRGHWSRCKWGRSRFRRARCATPHARSKLPRSRSRRQAETAHEIVARASNSSS